VRRGGLILAPLFGVFVAAMLLLPTGEGWSGDEGVYVGLARNLTHGFYRAGSSDGPLNMCFPGWETPDLWYGPGFPAFLAPLVALGLPVSVIRLVGPTLLLLSVLLFYRLLLETVGQRSALLGALGLGLFVPFYRYLPFLHSEFLALLLVIVAMIALTRALRTGSRGAMVVAAAALAGLALTRVAYGWVLTLLLLVWLARWLIRRTTTARRLVMIHSLALALCVPWLVYTSAVTGRPFLWGTSGSLSLYWMSSPNAVDRGDWHCASDVFNVAWLAPHRPFFVAHAQDSPIEQDRALERQARKNIIHHPWKYAENLTANASRILFNAPYSRRPLDLRASVFLIPGILLVTLLAVSAASLARRREEMPPEAAAFALFAAAAFAVHLPISAYVRMLIPMVPPMLWLIVYALDRFTRAHIARTSTSRTESSETGADTAPQTVSTGT
jgi:4-amino-4-deoxy-L-arabinose transferase-like glycosyltransferase